MARIFISHSYLDEAIAYKLVNFLLAALSIKEEEILCSSNPDQGLSYSSSSVPDKLKEELKNSEALIVLITADSLHSAWIPFEVGTFWTTDKPLIPILGPGLIHDNLPGPLRSLLSIPIDAKYWSDEVNNAINQLVEQLKIEQKVTKRRNDTLEEFSDALRAWQSQRPATDLSQQEEIEQLKAQIQDLEAASQPLQSEIKQLKEQLESERALVEQLQLSERAHEQQLEEKERLHSQELEKLEAASRHYQNQKQELEQSLTSQIKQLEQQLEQARSQNETDQNEIIRLREQIIERAQTANENKKPKPSQAQDFTEKLGNGITLDMVAIPGGKFMMGEPEGEGKDSQKPQHVVIVQAFYMGKYPITQAQYQEVMGNNPSRFKGNERPVEQVSWDGAVEFCKKLSEKTGKKYRLPSEAEWEYAARAGTTTKYYFGDDITSDLANYGSNVGETTAVGKYPPNAFGLYDMHGNVFEWCEDDWHSNYENAPTDGSAWLSGNSSKKVVRGGSWFDFPLDSRSASRVLDTRGSRLSGLGFRVVRVAPRTT